MYHTAPLTLERPETGRAESEAFRRLRQELRHAVQTGGLSLAFAPRVSLADGRICGLEAQLRWPRRRGAAMGEAGLAPLLAECGLSAAVCGWSLLEACRHAVAWQDVPLCVTATGAALHDGALLGLVGTALEETGLAADRLEIAIPEAALAEEPTEALLAIAALRDLGAGVALEAFGSAGANLMMIKRLPLTALKLDRALVREAPMDRESAAILAAAVDFGHALDMQVVARGVDTEAARLFVTAAGCDAATGGALNAGAGMALEGVA